MQIERDVVIEPDALIVNRVTTDETKTECDNLAALSPDEEARAARHPLRDGAKVLLCQRFKFQWRPLVDGQIQRVDFVDERRNLAHDLHLYLRRAVSLAEFSAQIFPGGLAERAKIFIPILITERQSRHRHAWNPGIAI